MNRSSSVNWETLFKEVFPGKRPRGAFQIEPARILLEEGKNVILQAPTGSGKTLAALFPFLAARRLGMSFPSKLIYSVPMRVLAGQFYSEYGQELVSSKIVGPLSSTIQTGEQPFDPAFSGDVVFATIDQTLSSFLLMPYGLGRRQANVNAGAVVGAYLVFDEFHLFDPESTFPTTLDMLDRLSGVSPFLLMTATFSGAMLDHLASWLKATVVPVSPEEIAAMPSQKLRQRVFCTANAPLSADAVLAQHKTRSLAVCNTVARARSLYQALRDHPDRGDTQVILLHSQFLKEDRQSHEDDVRRFFGKGDAGAGSVIAVGTQVVEVGLDISCENLHTELAPANSLLQRAGRCARFAGQHGAIAEGRVTVYPVENFQPYKDDGLGEECQLTWEALGRREEKTIDFQGEQVLVDEVHTDRDRAILENVRLRKNEHRREINRVLRGDEYGGSLIRNVLTRGIVVHDTPDVLLGAPWSAPSFSLHPGSVNALFERWQERENALGLPWAVKRLEETKDETEGGRKTRYTWVKVATKSDLRGAPLIVVHSALAGYRADEGFLPEESTGFRSQLPPMQDSASDLKISYKRESFFEHSKRVCDALNSGPWIELQPAATALERRAGWRQGTVETAAGIVAALHDVGKLAIGWQGWARDWQKQVGRPVSKTLALAHTDYDSDNPEHARIDEEFGRRRPSHAVEGAVAVAPILVGTLRGIEPVLRAAFTAIARHHGPFTSTLSPFRLDSVAESEINLVLDLIPSEIARRAKQDRVLVEGSPSLMKLDSFFADPDNTVELLCYMLLVRALRRADQEATRRGANQCGATPEAS